MKSKLYKVLHPVCGVPMVEHVLRQAEALQPEKIVTIVGFGAEAVERQLGRRTEYVLQEQQLGTGHAVMQTQKILGTLPGTTVVISGDTPLLTHETLQKLMDYHEAHANQATILTAEAADPFSYGRVIRDENGQVQKIVEQKDGTPDELQVKEINTGTYCFDNQALFSALAEVKTDNAQGEYYLPDVIEILKAAGKRVGAYQTQNFEESIGVNDRIALAEATKVMQRRINKKHMTGGVTLIDPARAYIDLDVEIGNDTVIEPDVSLKGATQIAHDCLVTSGSVIKNCQIEENVTITQSFLEDSVIHSGSDVGPFSHLRPESEIGPGVHIGNFVETKKAQIGRGTKVGHLTYVGDATLGEDINVGCGTIFVNFDGKEKHHTTVGNNVFIGCNANLLAPVTIAKDSFIAAGSTITDDVPEDALAIARARQQNKEGYAKKLPYNQK